jgi:two-component system phosphate regulon response regulator PhoB
MPKERILVVDDEEDILELVRFHLAREGYQLTMATSGEGSEEGSRNVCPDHPDLAARLDGLEVAKALKADAKTKGVLIVMLTAKGEDADVVSGLEIGADDYITKPFSPRVLTARVKAVLRRRSKASLDDTKVITIYELEIHPGRRTVLAGGEAVELTYTEFQLLSVLARRPGWVFTRSQIVDAVRGSDYPSPTAAWMSRWSACARTGATGITSKPCGAWATASGKTMRKPRKLVWRLFFSYIFIALGALVAAGWYFTHSLDAFLAKQIDVELSDRARLLENQIVPYLDPPDPAAVDAVCKLSGTASETRFTVILPSGAVIGDVGNAPEHG